MQTLDLNDLCPENSKFVSSARPSETFTLNKVTLRTQVWLRTRFGKDNIKSIFENQSIPEIAEIAYFLLQEKDKVKTLDDFFDLIVTQQDRVNLLQAMLQTIGISQPVIEKIAGRAAGGDESPGSTDWGKYYDLIASEYGYTIDQFLDLTMRQLCALANAIQVRTITEQHVYMSFHASLAGAEIASLEDILGVNLSGESNMIQEHDEKLTLLALKRMRERSNG